MTESEQSVSSPKARNQSRVFVGLVLFIIVGGVLWNLQPAPDINRAQRMLDIGDLESAQAELDRILAADPQHSAALLILGHLHRSKRDPAGAIRCYRLLPPESPDFRQASVALAQMLLETSDLAEAERQMQRHLELFPDERLIWDELRWLCFNQFRTRDVEELSSWWLKNHPDDTQALTHLLLGVFRPQVPQEGAPYLQQINQSVGQQLPVIRALAWAAWQSGRGDEARQLLEQAWQTGHHDARTRLLSAEILIEEQNYAAADRVLGEEPFEVAGAMFGGQVDQWHWLRSRLLLEQNLPAEALHHVERAIEHCHGDLKYVHSQAVLLKQLGRDQEASAAFDSARTMEQCNKRFAEIAFSGVWERPTPALRQQLADLYRQCGKQLVADLWQR